MGKNNIDKRIIVPRFNEANGFYTTVQKSIAMSKIKSKNTKPEMALRKSLWAIGLRYRINVKGLVGRPDIVFRKHKLAIFVDGDFWHGYNWEEKKKKIKTNKSFWIAKIERNMQRDKESTEKLIGFGFNVIRFWEHEIKNDLFGCIDRITSYIGHNSNI